MTAAHDRSRRQAPPAGPVRRPASAGAMPRSGASGSTACWRSSLAVVLPGVPAGHASSARATAPSAQTDIALDVTFDPAVIDPERQARSRRIACAPATMPGVVARCADATVSGGRPRAADTRRAARPGQHRDAASSCRRWCWNDPDADRHDPARRRCWPPPTSTCSPRATSPRDAAEGGPAGSTTSRSPGSTRWRPRVGLAPRFNTAFLTTATAREPELAGIWGAVIGSFLTHAGHAAAVASRSACARRSIWRSSRPRTAGPTSSRSTSTIWRRCRRSSSACSAWRCSSTSSACRAPRRWSAAWCWR